MSFYERHILLPLLSFAMGAKPIMRQRQKIVPAAEGRVLEIGIGAGHNLPYYDPARVTEVIGLEPSEPMRRRAARMEARVPVSFIGLEAEEIPLPDGAVDTVVVTYTLCTIPDVARALAGMRRVIRPGGRMLFCEHGRAPDASVQRWQGRIEPVWKRLAGGCHLTRDVEAIIAAGGFAIERADRMYLPSTPRFAGFNVWGSARPA